MRSVLATMETASKTLFTCYSKLSSVDFCDKYLEAVVFQHDLTPRIYVLHLITIALKKCMSYMNQKLRPSYQTALNLCLTKIENFGKFS